MALIAAGVMAAAGLVKNYAVDQPKAERDRKLEAATQRYSPWTGLKAERTQDADPMGTAMQFGATGASLYQGFEKNKLEDENLKLQNEWLADKRSPWSGVKYGSGQYGGQSQFSGGQKNSFNGLSYGAPDSYNSRFGVLR